jgi:hypothetical protein
MKRIAAALGSFGLAIALCAGGARAAEATVDLGTELRPILVVARMTPSGPPPGLCNPCTSECPMAATPPPAPVAREPSEDDPICVTSASYTWFVADVRQAVYGGPLPDRVYVQMWQHRDGTRLPNGDSTLWLINASPHGEYLHTGDNGRFELHVSPWGEAYLLLWPWWDEADELRGPDQMPCSVIEAREEVAASDFPGARQPLSPYAKEEIAKGKTANVHVDKLGISPRYGISMRRLQAHLAALGNIEDDDFECYDEEWAKYTGKPVPSDE